MKKLLFFILVAGYFIARSQTVSVPRNYNDSIKIKSLKKYMAVLTSDSLAGRETGEPGGEKAADYIYECFKKDGLEPGFNGQYKQSFRIWKTAWNNLTIFTGNDTLKSNIDYTYLGVIAQNDELEKKVFYLGHIDNNSYIPAEIKDQIAFVCLENLKSTFAVTAKLKKAGAWAIFAINPDDDDQFESINKKFQTFRKYTSVYQKKPKVNSTGNRLFVFPNSSTNEFFGINKDQLPDKIDSTTSLLWRPIRIKMPCDTTYKDVYNIAGQITGEKKDAPFLTLTAHYDHIGVQPDGEICRGADDNGSGTTALLELASIFKNIKQKPEYTIKFVAFTAEELGLWGSEKYTNEYQPKQFLANINMDMVGRHDTITKDNYVYLLGVKNSPWLDSLSREANKQSSVLKLDYYYDGSGFMNRSDHYNFYKNDVPVLSFFNGLHHDYHTPRDTMEKIDFPLLRKRVFLIFASAYLIAYDPESELKAKIK